MRGTILMMVLMLLVTVGCSRKEEGKQTELVTFKLRGEVVGLSPEKGRMMIAHEEIPDYMQAMTMPFKIKDSTLFTGIEVGDTVEGTLAVSRTESWIASLAVVGKGETAQLSAEDVLFRKLYKEGEPLPDYAFTNHEGKRIRFSDFRGKVLAFTFIYTRCPLPDFCIRMSDHFAKIQKALKSDRSLGGTWHLLTISFDPDFDTPAVLKKYGENYGADFGSWDFATDDIRSITTLADGLNLTMEEDEGGLIAHNLRTAVLDAKGNLAKIFVGNEWTPDDVVQEMRKQVRASVASQ
ncbi:MAG: SCO family protein [Bacteroidota bacterium]